MFGFGSQFFFAQPGDAKMLAEVFDCVSEGGGGIVDANGENRIDDAEREVVVTVLIRWSKVGKVEFSFTVVYNNNDFGFRNQEVPPGISKWWVSKPPYLLVKLIFCKPTHNLKIFF